MLSNAQNILEIVRSFTDNNYFIRVWPVFDVILPQQRTANLLCALIHLFVVVPPESLGSAYVRDSHGRVWIQLSRAEMAHYARSTGSLKSLDRSMAELEELGLLKTKTENKRGRNVLFWSLQIGKLGRFMAFAKALDNITRFNRTEFSKKIWYDFYLDNPRIVAEFKDLVEDFDEYTPPAWYVSEREAKKEAPDNALPGPERKKDKNLDEELQDRKKLTPIGEKVKQKTAKKKNVPKEDTPKDEFVEYWNAKPHVPKIKHGCASYAKASKALKAFRYKQLGTSPEYILSRDEQNDLGLRDLYKDVPGKTEYCDPKRKPRMSKEFVFEHLDMAAKVFDPQYTPSNSEYVGRLKKSGGASFFWTEHPDKADPKNTVRHSPFLLHLTKYQPKPLAEYDADAMFDKLDDEAKPLYDTIVTCLNVSWRRRRDAELRNYSEQQKVISIVKQYWDFFVERQNDLYDYMDITNFQQVIRRVERIGLNVAVDWHDMPITAFKKDGRKIWDVVFGLTDD